jgi:hypothetical protein
MAFITMPSHPFPRRQHITIPIRRVELHDQPPGHFRRDRYLYSASHYSGDDDFIPRTLAEDGDAMIMVNEQTLMDWSIKTRVLGLFKTQDRGCSAGGAAVYEEPTGGLNMPSVKSASDDESPSQHFDLTLCIYITIRSFCLGRDIGSVDPTWVLRHLKYGLTGANNAL